MQKRADMTPSCGFSAWSWDVLLEHVWLTGYSNVLKGMNGYIMFASSPLSGLNVIQAHQTKVLECRYPPCLPCFSAPSYLNSVDAC